MSKKFTCIVADPPYSFSDKLKMDSVARGAQANYNTMSIDEIKSLPIKDLTAKDGAILALWVPSSLLQDGLDIMADWGFKHKQTYIWVKNKRIENITKEIRRSISELFKKIKRKALKIDGTPMTIKDFDFILDDSILSFGMGRLFRQTHEICLVGINNNGIYKKLSNKSQRSVSFGENLKHSKKPEHLQDSLDLMFSDGKHYKLELFARRQRDKWVCLGNESPATKGEDIRISISKL